MGPLDLTNHLLNFVLPALAVAGLLVALSPLLGRPAKGAWGRWAQWAAGSAAGCAALVAGLVCFGRDGQMASYGLLVGATALSQWATTGGWRR